MEKTQYCAALPGCCYICRSSNREWYIDILQSIDFYGAVYICNSCIEEMATIAGMASVSQVAEMASKLQFFEEENFDLRVKNSGLEQAIDGLRIAGRSSGTTTESPLNVPANEPAEAVSDGEELVGLEGGKTPESDDDSDVGKLHTDESSSDRPSFSLNI